MSYLRNTMSSSIKFIGTVFTGLGFLLVGLPILGILYPLYLLAVVIASNIVNFLVAAAHGMAVRSGFAKIDHDTNGNPVLKYFPKD